MKPIRIIQLLAAGDPDRGPSLLSLARGSNAHVALSFCHYDIIAARCLLSIIQGALSARLVCNDVQSIAISLIVKIEAEIKCEGRFDAQKFVSYCGADYKTIAAVIMTRVLLEHDLPINEWSLVLYRVSWWHFLMLSLEIGTVESDRPAAPQAAPPDRMCGTIFSAN